MRMATYPFPATSARIRRCIKEIGEIVGRGFPIKSALNHSRNCRYLEKDMWRQGLPTLAGSKKEWQQDLSAMRSGMERSGPEAFFYPWRFPAAHHPRIDDSGSCVRGLSLGFEERKEFTSRKVSQKVWTKTPFVKRGPLSLQTESTPVDKRGPRLRGPGGILHNKRISAIFPDTAPLTNPTAHGHRRR